MRLDLPSLALALACALTALTPTSAQAQGLRERIQERMAQRRAAADPTAQATGENPGKLGPGDHTLSLEHEGKTRRYLVHVPPQYNASHPTPTVLAFHGGGGSMAYQANDRSYGLISKSDKEGFIAIFPNGVSPLPSGLLGTWNAGNCCGKARDTQADDVGFVRALLAQASQRLSLDPGRIYATGMSNGAMMAYRLACEMPGTFKAIAAVAGTDNTRACAPSSPVSILHIHAQNDTHVLFNGGAGKPFAGKQGAVTDFTSVPSTIDKWARMQGCSTLPQRALEVPGAHCETRSGCRGGAEVKLCVTETGGHSWPGGVKDRGEERPSQAISANDVMWEFFTRH